MVSKNGKYLTREQILGAQDIEKRAVKVPEWGGVVSVWGLSGRDREALEILVSEANDKTGEKAVVNLRAHICSFAIRDEEGKRLFTPADVEALGEKSVIALIRVADVASRLSRITPEDVEQLAKNSVSDPNADSPSA